MCAAAADAPLRAEGVRQAWTYRHRRGAASPVQSQVMRLISPGRTPFSAPAHPLVLACDLGPNLLLVRNLVAGGLDVCGVLVFVALGRASHDEAGSVTGFATTAWPFLVALAVGWGVVRAWRRPEVVMPVGVGVWLVTVAVGMVLRVVSGQGTALAFVLVALAFLAFTLLGWRFVAGRVSSR